MLESLTLNQRFDRDGCKPSTIIYPLGTQPDSSNKEVFWEGDYSYDGYPADVWFQYDDGVVTSAMLVNWP